MTANASEQPDAKNARAGRGRGNSRTLSQEDHERIFGKVKHRRLRPGRHIMHAGKLIHVDDLPIAEGADAVRARDATDQDSVAMGCALSQIPEINRRFSKHGVKFVPNPKHGETAVCRWKNRQSRLKYMKATGRHCFEETQG